MGKENKRRLLKRGESLDWKLLVESETKLRTIKERKRESTGRGFGWWERKGKGRTERGVRTANC